MKYIAYIEIDNLASDPTEERLQEILLEALIQQRQMFNGSPSEWAVKFHVHVECPSKRWTTGLDDY